MFGSSEDSWNSALSSSFKAELGFERFGERLTEADVVPYNKKKMRVKCPSCGKDLDVGNGKGWVIKTQIRSQNINGYIKKSPPLECCDAFLDSPEIFQVQSVAQAMANSMNSSPRHYSSRVWQPAP